MNKFFFEYLGQRINGENNLSDVVWAACQSNETLKKSFLKFFFECFNDEDKIHEFKREYSKNSSRPDFFCKTNKHEYIIENKIYDRNYHFEQYENNFPSSKFGFISNYKITSRKKWAIKTWEEFSDYLTNLSDNEKNSDTKQDFCGLNAYVKQVCNIIKLKTMDFSKINSLCFFNKIIDDILKGETKFQEIKYDNKIKNIDDFRYGKYYGIQKFNSNDMIWLWVGVYFNFDRVCIYTEISEEWCGKVYEFLQSLDEKSKLTEGNFYAQPYYDTDYRTSYAFEMKEEVFKKINDLQNVDEQKEIIKNYIEEVLMKIDKYY